MEIGEGTSRDLPWGKQTFYFAIGFDKTPAMAHQC